MNTKQLSIATGAPLSKETFDDFVARLKHDCVGDGVKRHYTADAIFVVQQKIRVYGVSEDYSGIRCVYRNEEMWESLDEFWTDIDDEDRLSLDIIAKNDVNDCETGFLGLDDYNKWALLEDDQQEFIVTSYVEKWQYVNVHLTRDAADAFIKRKKHDYKELRVYVDSQYRCWEFNEIKNAILTGKLVYRE